MSSRHATPHHLHRFATPLVGVLVLWIGTHVAAQAQQVLPVDQPRPMKQVFQDSSGTVWGKPFAGDVLLARWTGQGWQDTPVKQLPYPRWTARPAPPWN